MATAMSAQARDEAYQTLIDAAPFDTGYLYGYHSMAARWHTSTETLYRFGFEADKENRQGSNLTSPTELGPFRVQCIHQWDDLCSLGDFADAPFDSKQSMLDYFGSPEEVAGWVTGWMKKAKQKRKPLRKVIQHQLDLIKDQAKWEGMDATEVDDAGQELLRRVVQYSLEKYPQQNA